MPKAANKRKTRGDDSLDASSELLVQDGVTRPTKRSRGKSLSRLDETDDDASRGGSR